MLVSSLFSSANTEKIPFTPINRRDFFWTTAQAIGGLLLAARATTAQKFSSANGLLDGAVLDPWSQCQFPLKAFAEFMSISEPKVALSWVRENFPKVRIVTVPWLQAKIQANDRISIAMTPEEEKIATHFRSDEAAARFYGVVRDKRHNGIFIPPLYIYDYRIFDTRPSQDSPIILIPQDMPRSQLLHFLCEAEYSSQQQPVVTINDKTTNRVITEYNASKAAFFQEHNSETKTKDWPQIAARRIQAILLRDWSPIARDMGIFTLCVNHSRELGFSTNAVTVCRDSRAEARQDAVKILAKIGGSLEFRAITSIIADRTAGYEAAIPAKLGFDSKLRMLREY